MLMWFLWISNLVPRIVKSRSQYSVLVVFVENVEVLPGTDNNSGRGEVHIFPLPFCSFGRKYLCIFHRICLCSFSGAIKPGFFFSKSYTSAFNFRSEVYPLLLSILIFVSVEYVEVLPESPVHTGASASSAITIIEVTNYSWVWIMWKSFLVP